MIEIKEESNSTVSRIESLCKAYGYKLMYAYNVQYKDGGRKYLSMNIVPDGSNKYAPTISVDRKSLEVMIQTTSYGSLNIAEYEKFIEACDNAYNLAVGLSEIDFDKLPTNPDDEE